MQSTGVGALLERERELQTLRDGLERARAGEGALLLIEGPAGVGKTKLTREARAAAERAQMTVLEAKCSELEQPFAFGVVRQLLDPVVEQAAERSRAIRRRGGSSGAAVRTRRVATARTRRRLRGAPQPVLAGRQPRRPGLRC